MSAIDSLVARIRSGETTERDAIAVGRVVGEARTLCDALADDEMDELWVRLARLRQAVEQMPALLEAVGTPN